MCAYPGCGDGVIDSSTEQCDDGNTASGDGTLEICVSCVVHVEITQLRKDDKVQPLPAFFRQSCATPDPGHPDSGLCVHSRLDGICIGNQLSRLSDP